MTAQHTPGPWFQGCEDDPLSGDIFAEDSSLIAEAYINGEFESRVANARLIAAAPDLLEALQELVRRANNIFCGEPMDKARAAIAKATGSKA